jgi:hypothetical protein
MGVSVACVARLRPTLSRLEEIALWVRLEAVAAIPATEAVFPTRVLGPKLGIRGHRHATDRVTQCSLGG